MLNRLLLISVYGLILGYATKILLVDEIFTWSQVRNEQKSY